MFWGGMNHEKEHKQEALGEYKIIHPSLHLYKWKNHFSEMKGDVGMSCHLMKKKGNKKMPTQRQKVIQPHPYIFVFQCA